MDDKWEPNAEWLDVENGFVSGVEMDSLEEVSRRLRSYRRTDLIAVVNPVARYEQGLQPYFLAPEDERLITELLAVGDSPIALEEFARPLDAEWLRDLVRRTLIRRRRPVEYPREFELCIHRQKAGWLWLLESVAIGLTGTKVDVSVSGQWTADWPYPDSHPEGPNDADSEQNEFPEPWWRDFDHAIRVSDDRSTEYDWVSGTGVGWENPVRVRVDGQWEVRACERYTFYCDGIPPEVRELKLSGHIDLAIEEPTSEPASWPAQDRSLGDFSYTIDLSHWWPPGADRMFLEYLRRKDRRT